MIPSKEKPVNVKLFSNGSVQMTGCKSITHSLDTLEQLYSELKIVKAVIDRKKMKIVEKPFVTDTNKLTFEYISKFKVVMINSNFNVEFNIDRQKLHDMLKKDGNESSYDPNRHACVNVKYYHPDKEISVFVFEKGSIIITGAKNCVQIRDAYDFINKYLYTNYIHIKKVDNISSSNIMQYLGKK
jgi:TATA-box binding protein (TBP) (component of TFIID and TFIIIB)